MRTAIREISGAKDLFDEGEGFFRVVESSHRKPAIFTPEIVHNLLCMAIEKYAMSILLSMGALPDNHTFSDLVEALKPQIPVSPGIEEALLALDQEADLCSLELRQPSLPTPDRMEFLKGIGRRFKEAAREAVLEGNTFTLQLESIE
jgi:hypothetical protein